MSVASSRSSSWRLPLVLVSRSWRILPISVRICRKVSLTRCQEFSVVWLMRLCLTGSTQVLSCWGSSWIVQASRGREDLGLAGWGYLVAGFGLHFVGNSPFSQIVTELPIAIPVLNATGLFPIYQAYQTVERLEQGKIKQKNAYVCTHTHFCIFKTELAEELGNEFIWSSIPCDFSKDLPGAGEVDLKQVYWHTEGQAFVDRLQAFNSFLDEM